jgi:hypothetical protein
MAKTEEELKAIEDVKAAKALELKEKADAEAKAAEDTENAKKNEAAKVLLTNADARHKFEAAEYEKRTATAKQAEKAGKDAEKDSAATA